MRWQKLAEVSFRITPDHDLRHFYNGHSQSYKPLHHLVALQRPIHLSLLCNLTLAAPVSSLGPTLPTTSPSSCSSTRVTMSEPELEDRIELQQPSEGDVIGDQLELGRTRLTRATRKKRIFASMWRKTVRRSLSVQRE